MSEGLLQPFHIPSGDQKDLTIRGFPWSDPDVGGLVGFLQQPIHHLLGLPRLLQPHRGSGQGLATAQHDGSTAQGQQVLLQGRELLFPSLDPVAHTAQFSFRALDIDVPGLDVGGQSVPFLLQLTLLLLQWFQLSAQGC